MRTELHELIHALVRLEKYHEEQKRYIEIVNKLVNEMILKEDGNGQDMGKVT